jgi:hypothetical protein
MGFEGSVVVAVVACGSAVLACTATPTRVGLT